MKHGRRLGVAAATVALATVIAGCSAGGSDDDGGSAADTGGGTSESSNGSSGGSNGGGSGNVPAFSSTTVDGAAYDSSQLEGQDAVLWFWAPWCAICRAESGEVAAQQKAFGDDVTFLGVGGLSSNPEDMESFVTDTGTDAFPHLSDTSGDVWRAFGVTTQPSYAFIDENGDVSVVVGSLSGDDLESRIQALI